MTTLQDQPSSKPSDGTEERDMIAKLMFSFTNSMVLGAVVDLEIPNILARGGGQLSLNEIAQQLPSKTVQMDYLFRIMRFAVEVDLFNDLTVPREAVPTGERRYGLTPYSSLLVEDNNPSSFVPAVRIQTSMASLKRWSSLPEAILTGIDPYRLVHGEDLWDSVRNDPKQGEAFNKSMVSLNAHFFYPRLKDYQGFRGLKQLVDVGGGLGATLATITRAYPEIQGINFDLPNVISQAKEIPGVNHVGGDMFRSVPQGDAILLKWILHDWSNDESIKILRNCHKSLSNGGKVIVVEYVLDEIKRAANKNGTTFDEIGLVCDLLMLTYTTGRERTSSEWHQLLDAAGFTRVEIIRLSSSPSDLAVIEGYK